MRTTLADWLAQAPFTLGLSAGFFGFYAHTGVVVALTEAGFVPKRVAGASAGALVGGMLAGGVAPKQLVERLTQLDRDEFWDPAPGLGLLRGHKFRSRLRADLGQQDVADLAIPAALSVYDLTARRAIAPVRGDLATIIQASCAVPGMFHPVMLNGRPHVDGGVTDRSGFAGVTRNERVFYHHLAARSPWRRRGSPSLDLPAHANMRSLVIDDLPRVHPFALQRGPQAYTMAYEATKRALDAAV